MIVETSAEKPDRGAVDLVRFSQYIAGMGKTVGTEAEAASASDATAMRVLASGSSGNCTVIAVRSRGRRRIILIDLGLTPNRTQKLLADSGLDLDDVDHVLLTHLDADHYRPTWRRALPRRVRLHAHRQHARIAWRRGAPSDRIEPFDSSMTLDDGIIVTPRLFEHDGAGVCAFRLETGRGVIGYGTDLGRPTEALVEHLRGVDALALESNYCPWKQQASTRPAFLKRRIMGGAGHLSNEQCAEVVREVSPREHVVLLHLSRQCNTPALAAEAHHGATYTLTIAEQQRPTSWVRLGAGGQDASLSESLFERVSTPPGSSSDRSPQPGPISARIMEAR